MSDTGSYGRCGNTLFAILPVSQQWEVHRYYQPSNDLTQDQPIVHRKAVTQDEPSLPARAGKSFAKLYCAFRFAFEESAGDEQQFRRILWHLAPHAVAVSVPGKKQVRIMAVARPEPDLERLAWALIDLARSARQQDTEAA